MVHPRLWILCATALMASPLLAQTPAPPAALDRQWLAGAWKLDKSGPPEDRANWDRPTTPKTPTVTIPCVTPNPPQQIDGSRGPVEPCKPAVVGGERIPELGAKLSLRSFGSQLIVESADLVINAGSDAVTIDDEFREPTRYLTNGRAVSIKVVTQNARSTGTWYVSPPRSMTVSVKSSWNGDALVQELRTRDLMEIVKITRTFIPADAGRKMILVIKVLEPKLKEPVKDIERVYVRQPS